LALMGAIMLALKPSLAHDVSFQLSFAGTAGIAAMTDGIAARLGWMPSLLGDPFAATIAAEAATLPLMLASFHQLSIVAPAANALVLPLLPAIMVLGGGGALLAAVMGASAWPLTQLLGSILSWPLIQASGAIAHWFRIVVETAGSLPLAAVVMPTSHLGGWPRPRSSTAGRSPASSTPILLATKSLGAAGGRGCHRGGLAAHPA
jgi:predicted membrane metal-binding protein